MTTNYINQTPETAFTIPNLPSKKANITKTAAAAALITIAGAVHGQNSATIDPKYYSMSNPFEVPNLPNLSNFNLIIKAGEKVPVTINDIDINGTTFLRGPVNGSSVAENRINDLQNNTIYIDKSGGRERDYKKTDGTINHIAIIVNYQADIYDRTPGSSTQNQRPEVIIVDPGQSATLSAGKNMNPTGVDGGGRYKRKGISDAAFETGSSIDSTKVKGVGTYVVRTNESVKRTNDTISVVERPTANNSAKTLNFATTVNGVIYKVYKFQPAAGAPMSKAPSESQTDGAWVEVPSLSFVGDGNPRSVAVNLGSYRIGAQRTANTETQQDTKTVIVDFGTDVLEIEKQEKNTFKQANRELSRETEVPSIIYNINGQEMATALASNIRIPDQATAGVYIVRFTENGKIHTKKIVIK